MPEELYIMNASDLFPPSQYLKSEDVDAVGEMLLTITSVSRKEYTDEQTGKKEVKGELNFAETEKKMAINVTNTNALIAMYGGTDIDKVWVGKSITIFVDHNVKYGTKIVSGLRIRVTDAKQDAVTEFWKAARKLGMTTPEGLAHVKEFAGDFSAALAALDNPF
jgi:hypothetical protein